MKRDICCRNQYFGHTNPGIYTGDYEKMLALYSHYEMFEHPIDDEFDAIWYIYGTYFLSHVLGSKTVADRTLYPIPYNLLDEDNSISFGELVDYCNLLKSDLFINLKDVYCRETSFKESVAHGFHPEKIRYWQDDDRIAFLHPFRKTEFIISSYDFRRRFHFQSPESSFIVNIRGVENAEELVPRILYDGYRPD